MNNVQDIQYSPTPANNRARLAVALLFAAALIGFVVSFFIGGYSGTVQLVCLFLIVYALFIASRFLFVSYTYSLFTNEKGRLYFLIEEKQGKRSSLVCQLPFHRVRAIKPLAEAKEELGGRYYTYVASMSGGAYYIVAVDGERGRVGIKIEPSAAFVAAFREALAAKATPQKEDPENPTEE